MAELKEKRKRRPVFATTAEKPKAEEPVPVTYSVVLEVNEWGRPIKRVPMEDPEAASHWDSRYWRPGLDVV